MSDLFGSDEGSEASDEDFNLTKEKIANGKENNVSSSDEQSGVEDVNDVEGDENDDDDGDDDNDMVGKLVKIACYIYNLGYN